MKLVNALQACLPLLELGLGVYDGWTAVIVYPSGFVTVYVYEAGYSNALIMKCVNHVSGMKCKLALDNYTYPNQ